LIKQLKDNHSITGDKMQTNSCHKQFVLCK